MLSIPLRTAAAATLAFSLLSQTSVAASMNAMTYVGCFSSSTPLSDLGSYTWQASGYCQEQCYDQNKPAFGLSKGSDCYCGNKLPAEDDMVDDSHCDEPCNGYPSENCGSEDGSYFSVYKSGLDNDVGYYGGSSSSSSSSSSNKAGSSSQAASSSSPTTASTTTNAPVVVTSEAPGRTVVITLAASAAASSTALSESEGKGKNGGGGTNTAGIAAGVVVGVVVVAAIAGGVFFFLRQRKRKAIEEEYSKRSQAQDYSASGMAGLGGSVRSANDARLDPEAMMHRRLSDGSIADEQDYSRRILKVTNPDGR